MLARHRYLVMSLLLMLFPCICANCSILQVCLCVTGEVITTAAASVAYVDSGGGFSVGRLREMLKRKHLEEKVRRKREKVR